MTASAGVSITAQRVAAYRLGFARMPAPFGRNTFIAAHGTETWVGDNERPELRVYDTAGRLRRIVRWTLPPRPIPGMIQALPR